MVDCKLTFGKGGRLDKKGQLCYAKYIFEHNPIRKSELNLYAGKTKRNPHGIPNPVWKKAYDWAKKTNNLTIQ